MFFQSSSPGNYHVSDNAYRAGLHCRLQGQGCPALGCAAPFEDGGEEPAGGTHAAVTDEELASVVQKQAKQRQDSIEQFTAANRPDLAEKEAAELSILKDYLPEPLSEEELAAAIDAAIAALGVTNMSGMGKVIQSVMGDYKGRVDGKAVSAAVKARLS